jgi:pilus assembly protein Flp/PilA
MGRVCLVFILQTKDCTMNFIQSVKNFSRDEEGIAAIEYALLAGLIAIALIAAATALGTGIAGIFTKISTKLSALAV